MIYANHAGTSWPKPPEVHEAGATALLADPSVGTPLFEASRAEICCFLGIPAPEGFLFTTGCTSALAVAFSDLPWTDGDIVVTSALEHHALARPVEQLVMHRGVRHVVAPYGPGEPIDVDFVRDVLRRGGVRLVAATHASNVTGELLPARELALLAHEHEAWFLLDAAQTVGVVPVDVHALGADIFTFAGHKGPQGPQGIGALWASPAVVFESPGAVCEIGQPTGRPRRCAPAPGYCDVGSANLAGAAALAAGIRFIENRGLDACGGHARRLAASLLGALGSRHHCTVYGGNMGERTAAVSLRIEGLALDRAEAFFREHGVVVRAGQHCAPMALEAIGAPAGTVRISFGWSNDAADVDAVLRAVDAAAPDGVE